VIGILDLVWRNNTSAGRFIIVAIVVFGVMGGAFAAAHWLRYAVHERSWLENVRGRLRRTHDAGQAAESGEPGPLPLTGEIDLRQLAEGIPTASLIGDRLDTILRLRQARVKIDVATLQQSSILKESANWSLSFPAYVVSMVMMLGLLGTFVGLSLMVADIQHALPDPSAQASAANWAESVSSLGRILAGKKTAFSATLVGIFFSLVVSLANFGLARAQSSFYDVLERFTGEELLPASVPEDGQTPWEKLSRQLGNSFGTLQTLVTAQARSAEQMATVETAFGTIIQNIETITQRAATAPLLSAAGDMTSVIGQLLRVQDAILALTEHLPQVVVSFRETQESTAHEIQTAMGSHQGSIERLTRALQSGSSTGRRWGLGAAAAGALIAVAIMLLLRAVG
jgi:hypothetical protein